MFNISSPMTTTYIVAGIAKVFIQAWNKYEKLLKCLGYKIISNNVTLLCRNIEKDPY